MFQEKQKIGPYTLIRKLARGGFGEVWLAEKESQFVTKKVAVKLPHNKQIEFDAIRQEATLWEQASGHPNVLPLIDADVYDGQVAIVSEYADGGSLADFLKIEGGRVAFRRAAEIAVGILSGLEYLHAKNIVHRDIKPANVLLQNGTPRLADFGISRAMTTKDFSSSIVGTESYMSPEAFEGVRSVQTDVWSVGVVLYQMLAGFLPFAQAHPTETMYAVLMKEPAPLPADVPARLAEIVFKSLEKDRTANINQPRRYQTAAAMRDDLRTFLETQPAPLNGDTAVIPVMPLAEMGEDYATRVKIPVKIKYDNFWQSILNRPKSPGFIFAAIFLFAVVGWSAIYMIGLVFASGADNALPENTNAAAVNTNIVVDSNASANLPANLPVANNQNSKGGSAFDYFIEGNKNFDRKRYDRAIESYTKAIEINPADYTFYSNRGLAHYQKRDYAAAIGDFDRALEINPNVALIYNNRGVAFEDSGNRGRAVEDYRKAVELDPTDQKARDNLNKILR